MTLNFTSSAYGHDARVFDLSFHPQDLGCLASASEDGTARVWAYDATTNVWDQVACCPGHSGAEALRVAWGTGGALLASGGADGVVKLWRGPGGGGNGSGNGSGGGGNSRSYAAEELLSFEGHPEEVYALEFVPPPGSSSSSSCDTSSSTAPWLLTGSGQSLFLWDIEAGALVQEAAPPSAVDAASRERFGGNGGGGSAGDGSSDDGSSASSHGKAPATGSGGGFPPYVFALSLQQQARAGNSTLVAAACCDGGARLWQLSNGALDLVAELQVHADMAATCAFSPSRPHLLASLSKGGEVAVVDVRRASSGGSGGAAAAVVARHQLPGPVFACSWFAKPAGSNSSSSSSSSSSDFLAVVGADSRVRIYDGASLCTCAGREGGASAAALAPVESAQMPCGYDGRMLALAVASDGSRLAVGGEPVPTAQLRPLARSNADSSCSGGGNGAAPAARRRRTWQRASNSVLGNIEDGGGLFEQLSIGEPAAAQAAAAPAAHGEPGHGRNSSSVAKERAPIFTFAES